MSPDSITLVSIPAIVLMGTIISVSVPCPASSMNMCEKWPCGNPTQYGIEAEKQVLTTTRYFFNVSTGGTENMSPSRNENGRSSF